MSKFESAELVISPETSEAPLEMARAALLESVAETISTEEAAFMQKLSRFEKVKNFFASAASKEGLYKIARGAGIVVIQKLFENIDSAVAGEMFDLFATNMRLGAYGVSRGLSSNMEKVMAKIGIDPAQAN